jgi:hypothetical protein
MARCTCKTSKGDQCKKDAVEGSKYCSIHKKRCVTKAKAKVVPKAKKFDAERLVKKVATYSKRNPDSSFDDLLKAMRKEFGAAVDDIKVQREIAKVAVAALKAAGYVEKPKAKKVAKKPKKPKEKGSEAKQKLLGIIKRLRVAEAKAKGPGEIYFAGEYDPIQTDFERRSNLLEVGVLTKGGPKVGFAALHILRYIIDKNFPALFADDMEAAEDDKKAITKFMQDEESRYGSRFPSGPGEAGVLRARVDDQIIEKTLSDVEVWTLEKLEKRVKRFK